MFFRTRTLVGRPRRDWVRSLLRDESGFTLTELLVVCGMLGISLSAAFFFYMSVVSRTTETEARVSTLAEVRNAGEIIARDVREGTVLCSPVPTPSGGVLHVLGPPESGSLETAADCAAGASRIVTYDCNTTPGTCTRSVGGATPTILVEDLDTAQPVFATTGDNYVSIQLSKLPDDRDRPIAFERGVALRNHCMGACP